MAGFDFGSFPGGITDGLGGGAVGGFGDLRGTTSGRGGVPYPNPFFDGAHTYLPGTMKKLFKWCRYYFLTNPLINAVCYKMASYPITDLVFTSEHKAVEDKYTHVKDDILNYRQFLVEAGLDYQCYGNAFVSIHYPFIKSLPCVSCKHSEPVKQLRKFYQWRDMSFVLKCPKCGNRGKARTKDVPLRSPNQIKLIRWDPERISIQYNEETGDTQYFYRMSARTRGQLLVGKPHVIEVLPEVFIKAAKKKLSLKFAAGQIFHLKRPTLAGKDQGWGMPRILPVLKDAFYLQVLKKGQEMIAREHIVPLRVLFPQAGSGTSDPYTTVPLQGWKNTMEEEIERWRRDPNYIPILPMPVGHQVIGGQGRAMVLHQEHRVWAEHIIAGMHAPQEFIFGGMSYSGTNVSMRNLENEFINYRTETQGLTDWVFDSIGAFMGWPKIKKQFKRFRMADDLQRTMIYFQMNQGGKVSDHTLLRELGESYDHEQTLKRSEGRRTSDDQRRMQVASAVAQAEAQQVSQRYMQAAGQDLLGGATPGMEQHSPPPGAAGALQAPGAPGPEQGINPENATQAPAEGVPAEAASQIDQASGAGGNSMNVLYVAKRVAHMLDELLKQDPKTGYAWMQKMKMEQPNFLNLVLQIMQSKEHTRDPLSPTQSPLPGIKPPRRDVGSAIV